jgi:hypothetical protein
MEQLKIVIVSKKKEEVLSFYFSDIAEVELRMPSFIFYLTLLII